MAAREPNQIVSFNDPDSGLRWTAWPRCLASGLFLSACAQLASHSKIVA